MKNLKSTSLFILKDFLLAVLAGMCISIGGIAFLACESKVAGSLFFTVGLFTILAFDLNLFTGKICFALDNKPTYLLRLPTIWIGNLAGAVATGYLASATRLVSLQEKCIQIANTKLNDNLGSIFVLAILCNIMIFIAVFGYLKFENPLIKIVALFFGISVFVLCGFEHCVADMFYFSFADAWSAKTFGYLMMITLGNAVGGLLFPSAFKLKTLLDKHISAKKE